MVEIRRYLAKGRLANKVVEEKSVELEKGTGENTSNRNMGFYRRRCGNFWLG